MSLCSSSLRSNANVWYVHVATMDEEETTENNIRQASATTMPCTPSSSSLAKGQSSSKQQRGVEGAQSPEAFSNALQSPIRHDNDMTPSFASGTSEHQAPTFRKYVDQLTVKLYVEWDGTPGLRLAPLQSWQCASKCGYIRFRVCLMKMSFNFSCALFPCS